MSSSAASAFGDRYKGSGNHGSGYISGSLYVSARRSWRIAAQSDEYRPGLDSITNIGNDELAFNKLARKVSLGSYNSTQEISGNYPSHMDYHVGPDGASPQPYGVNAYADGLRHGLDGTVLKLLEQRTGNWSVVGDIKANIHKNAIFRNRKKKFISASFFDNEIFVGTAWMEENGEASFDDNATYGTSTDRIEVGIDSWTNRGFSLTTTASDVTLDDETDLKLLIPRGGWAPYQNIDDEYDFYKRLRWEHGNQHALRDIMGLKYVKNVLMPHHRVQYKNSDYSFSNYQCLNFFLQVQL